MQANQLPQTINLSGSLTIDRASALKSELSSALKGSEKVIVNVSSIAELDLSCIQVLYAAKVEAKASNKVLHFVGSPPSHIVGRLVSCGFFRGAPGESAEFESAFGVL